MIPHITHPGLREKEGNSHILPCLDVDVCDSEELPH